MITVKLFGLLRLQSGIRHREMDADSVKAALQILEAEGIDKKELRGCVVLVNGKPANKRTKLQHGDTVMLMPPVAGG